MNLKVPINTKTGEPFTVGDELISYTQAGPVLDAWGRVDVGSRPDFHRDRDGIAWRTIPNPTKLHEGVILIKLPPQWEEPGPKTLDLGENCTLKEVREAMRGLREIRLKWPKGICSVGSVEVNVDGGWTRANVVRVYECLQLGGTVKVL